MNERDFVAEGVSAFIAVQAAIASCPSRKIKPYTAAHIAPSGEDRFDLGTVPELRDAVELIMEDPSVRAVKPSELAKG